MTNPLLFSAIDLREVRLKNRIVVAPMHQYSGVDGFPVDWHLMNAGRFAAGGSGLVIVESTKVERRGCGTLGDLGLWHDDMVPPMRRLADFIRQSGSVPGIQIGHSGRKARRFRPWEGAAPLQRTPDIKDWEDWELVAPSALADEGDPEPRALSRNEIPDLVEAWGRAAARADEAGFDMLEIHAAHGYLVHQFLSPVANRRNDDYGGSEANRMRFAIEIVECVRQNWPDAKPLFLRLSVEDDAGWGPDESVALSRLVGPKGVDVIDCSSGGILGAPVVSAGPVGYGYQVPYAERIKTDTEVLSMAVGLIVHADQAERILRDGRADLIALARELLFNPNWPLDAALKLGYEGAYDLMPSPYSFWLEKRAQSITDMTPSTFISTSEAGGD